MRLALPLLVAACGSSAPKPTPTPVETKAKMASFTLNGYTLTSAEY